MQEKLKLTKYRMEWMLQRPAWITTFDVREIERRFGSWLFVPLDVEPIRPNNEAHFKEWYFEHARGVCKVYEDVAGPAGGKNKSDETFLSIDSAGAVNHIWQNNVRLDIFTEFPELKEGLKQLPFYEVPDFQIWSSMRVVSAHRDQGPWLDLPFSFRVSLFDDNPFQTLSIREVLPDCKGYGQKLSLPAGLNTFAWNNLRVKHQSTFNPAFRKALLITSQQDVDMQRYCELMERSLTKFGDNRFKSRFQTSDFVGGVR